MNKHETGLALKALKAGQCVAIPTETVYGLAADATNGEAVARIFDLKKRPGFNPLICHVDSLDMAMKYGKMDLISRKLAERFWPGPLTLVVPLSEPSDISPLVTAGLDSIGLRQPKSAAAMLISEFGKPLAAPSANRSGRISPTTAAHVADEFPDTGLVILDQGSCEVGLESTIVKIENGEIILLRPGAITKEMIKETTGISPILPATGKIEAPGMMQSHYAPDAKVSLNAITCAPENAWLQFGPDCEAHPQALNLSIQGDLLEAAANLYGMMKSLDAMRVHQICVSPIPASGIGIAINDRLQRAAAPRETS